MLVNSATEQRVYIHVSMFRRSSKRIQIVVASKVLMSAGAKKFPFFGAQRLGSLPKGQVRNNRTCCKQNVFVSKSKTKCLDRGPRT